MSIHLSPLIDSQTLIRWLVAGNGIACVPLMWVIDEINAGKIEILFAHYHANPLPVYALYTQKDKLPLKVQVCINYLTDYFDKVAEFYQAFRAG
ncbi:transcriptional regulator [Erwinia tracheiphila PSU-1]|nr:transcriptional regulator [Erwinia tracheiphila PSU-1]